MPNRMARMLRHGVQQVISIAVLGAVLAAWAAPRAASAASLAEVTSFGSNPSGLRMFLYVPDTVKPHPAVLVAVHFCTGSGPVFFSNTEFASQADQHGFIVIYPSATRSGNCFDVSTPQSLNHNSTSDPAGIVSMVRFVIQNFGADASRVFVTGASSGGMMTNVLLGDYPDVFQPGQSTDSVGFCAQI